MSSTATFKWIGLALLGIAVAAAVAIAASNLAGQQIGLASESISAGDALAPASLSNRGHGPASSGHGQNGPQTTPTAPPETTQTAPSTPAETTPPSTTVETSPPESGDDHGGSGGGHGADD